MTKELRAKRANLATQANAILERARVEKRDLTAEESTQFDTLHVDIARMKGEIDRIERQEELNKELRESQGTAAGAAATAETREQGQTNTPEEQRSAAFRSWLVNGISGLTTEERGIMATRQASLTTEQRAMAAGVDTAGGYTVFDTFVAKIETALKAFSGVRNTRATIMRTNTGNQINMPTSDDTSNKGALVGENVDVGTITDPTLGSKALRAYMFTSKPLRVSLQFLQDTNMTGVENWIAGLLGERIGRALAPYYITGTGNNQPEGLASAATLGVTGTSTTAITYDEMIDLEHSIDPAYRRQAEWLLADGLVKAVKKLKDGEGRPLWVPGVAVREPDTILGYRYAVDMEIPTPAASAITAYFGDFSKFLLRDVGGMQMLRLTERYAEYLQVAFLLFSRHDSILLDAGTHPIKYFVQSA